MSTQPVRRRAPRVPAAEARARILEAARELLCEQPFHELTVDTLMARAGLSRTVFYRHFDDLPQMTPELLPDAEAPTIDALEEIERTAPEELVAAMVDGLVELFGDNGPLLRAIDHAATRDREVAEQLDTALVAPRALVERLLRGAPHPPPDVPETARLMLAAQRAYLLDCFGEGEATPEARDRARAALGALWDCLLAD